MNNNMNTPRLSDRKEHIQALIPKQLRRIERKKAKEEFKRLKLAIFGPDKEEDNVNSN